MGREFTAVYKKSGKWYLGWVEEIPGVNAQGRTRKEVKENLKPEVENGELGKFLKLWSIIESDILERAKKYKRNVFNIRRALFVLMEDQPNLYSLMKEFDHIRNFRNKLVHNPASISKRELIKMTNGLENLINEYKKAHNNV